MQISDVMTSDVEVIRPDASIRDAAMRMRDLDVGSLPVCDGNKILGMISDRDITLRATAKGANPDQTRVEEVMTRNIVYCYEDQDVKEAGKVMGYNQIRRLPILNREKRLVGILSLGDISTDVKNDQLSGETLQEVSLPSRPQQK
jgi:CBS domain-containing protein